MDFFDKLNKDLSKIDDFQYGDVLEKSTFSEIDHFIHSGNYLLNASLSGSLFGGFADCKSYGLAGDPGSGKTFLCLNAVRESQKIGYDVIYAETEGAIDRGMAEKFGINTSKIRYQPIKTVTQFRTLVNNILTMVRDAREKDEKPRILLVLDSIGMLTTNKEIKDAEEGKNAQDMGLKAKELRSLFRTITLDLTANRIPFIMTNHTSAGGMFAPKTQSGGDGPVFSCSNVSFLGKSNIKTDGTKTGILVKVRPHKSRFSKPIDVQFHISFTNGMNPYVGLEEYIDWETCGIEKGNILTKKEYEKLTTAAKAKAKEFTNEKGDTVYFVAKKTAQRYIVEHLGRSITSKEIFTPTVFTEEVLKRLDVKVQEVFRLPDLSEDLEEITELLEKTVEDGEEQD